MLNLTKRVSKLLEKTSSLETKKACQEVLEMYNSLSEEQLSQALVEKLKGIADSDSHVNAFVQTSEKYMNIRDLGIAKAISNIRESQSYHYPALRYTLDRFEAKKVNEGVEDYLVVEEFVNSLRDFTWDKNVKESLDSIREKYEALKESVLVSKALYDFRKAKGNFLYAPVCEKLEDHFENPTEASRSSLIETLAKFSFAPAAKNLMEALKKMGNATKKGALNIVAENNNSSVDAVYSTVILENGKEYFTIKGDVYKKTGSLVEKVGTDEFQTLSENIRRSYQIFNSPYFFVKEGKASFYIGRNKVEILEADNSKQVRFNGKDIPGFDIAKNLVSTGMLRLEEAKVASDIQFVNDIFENFYELDFAKVISSKIYEGSFVTLMKADEKLYLNKVNTSMKVNEFFSDINVSQARNIILEFLGYDIKESMEEFIEKDEAEIRAIKEEQTNIVKNMTIIEGEIFKVEAAKKDVYLASTPQIKSLEETLRNELHTLKAQYEALSAKLKKFEAKTSDAGVEIGQDVKLENGDLATVTAIDSNNKKISVVTADGKTKEIDSSKIHSVEAEEKAAMESNEKKGEEEAAEAEDDQDQVEEGLTAGQKKLPKALQAAILKKQGEKPEEEEEKVEEAEAIAGGGAQVPVEDPNKDDLPSQEPTQTEEAPAYVKAIVADDQGGSCAGKEVEVLATDFTSKGDEDLIQVKCGEDLYFIEKKFLTVPTTEGDDSLSIDFDAEAPGDKKEGGDEKKDDEKKEEPKEDDKSDDDKSEDDDKEEKKDDEKSDDKEEKNDDEEKKPTMEELQAKLAKALQDLEDIKNDMKDTFTSNETISTSITSLRGLVTALGKDLNEAKKK